MVAAGLFVKISGNGRDTSLKMLLVTLSFAITTGATVNRHQQNMELAPDDSMEIDKDKSLVENEEEPYHHTILGGDSNSSASVALQRCVLSDCCQYRVHCPFCDIRQYKPANPSRVRDHLHLTHFQHAVYYNGLMIVKCFHACREKEYKGGHYHCPVCSTTLLKRNAFTRHLQSHASDQGLDKNAVQAPDSKMPAAVHFEDMKIDLCEDDCQTTHEPHFHCPLCRQSCEQLSALTLHLWRCKKQAASVAAKAENGTGYTLDASKLFSSVEADDVPHLKDIKELKWHLSIVRNLSDLPLSRCEVSACCKGRYHCPLCTTAKLKPNHHSHMKQHLVSHWRSGVKFKDYTVLVCYLPCQRENGADAIRFHYHCPVCGATRRRREGFSRHLLVCDPDQREGQSSEDMKKLEDLDQEEEECVELSPFPEAEIWPSDHGYFNTVQATSSLATSSRRTSADQAELLAAQSLADLDRIVTESLHKPAEPQTVEESPSNQTLCVSVDALKSAPDSALSQNNSAKSLLPSSAEGSSVSEETVSEGESSTEKPAEEGVPRKSAGSTAVPTVKSKMVTAVPTVKSKMVCGTSQSPVPAGPSSGTRGRTNRSRATFAERSKPKRKELPSTKEVVSMTKQALKAGTTIPDQKQQQHSHDHLRSLSQASKKMNVSQVRGAENISHVRDDVSISHVCDDVSISHDRGVTNISDVHSTTNISNVGTGIGHLQETTSNFEPESRSDIETGKQSEGDVLLLSIGDETSPSKIPTDSSETQQPSSCLQKDESQFNQSKEISKPSKGSADESTHLKLSAISKSGVGTKENMAGNLSGTATKKRTDHPEGRIMDDVQIFQKVCTQISDSIVSQLRQRSILEQSLQAIGRVCKVAWQRNGASVTMTCELEELCYAQTCLQQILKKGLKSFLNSPPTDTTKVTTSPSPTKTTAKKKGRPKGSKNKATLLRAGPSGPIHTSKQMKLDNTAASRDGIDSHRNSITSDDVQESGSTTPASQIHKDAHQTNSNLGRYSGRTRGKRINFAQLNAGHLSPEEETKPSTPISSPKGSASNRPWGRPRKTQPVANTTLLAENRKGKRFEDASTASKEDGMRKNEGRNGICQISDDEVGEQEARQRTVRDKTATSFVEKTLTSDALNKTSENSGCTPVARNLKVMVMRLDSATKELSTSVQLQAASSKTRKNESKENSEEERIPERKRTKSPMNLRRGKRRRSQAAKDAASFAIIPNIIFNFASAGMAEEEEEGFEPASLQENSDQDVRNSDKNSSDELGIENTAEEDNEKEGEGKHAGNSVERQRETSESHSCPVCKLTFNSYPLLAQHISSRHHRKGTIKCDVCEIACQTSRALTLHLERRHGPKMESPPVACKCSKCGMFCASAASLAWHQSLVHIELGALKRGRKKSMLKCTACDYIAIDRWDMRQHSQQHRLKTPTCPICSKTLGTEAAVRVHVAATHSKVTFACQVCSKTFAHMRYLRSHMQRHEGKKRHACPICGWRFHQTNTLQAHMDTHKPRTERKFTFKCPHCPAATNSRANYKDHLNKHTGDKPHVCSKCGKGFAFRSMLTTHTTFLHNADRPFQCKECDKKYKTKVQLKQHMVAHKMAVTGVSPYMCNKCNRPQASSSRRNAHQARCKGSKVLWRPGVTPPAQGNGAQAVTGQSVKLQAPLLGMLPGQRINIVHQQGFGKDTIVTLMPAENEVTAADLISNQSLMFKQEEVVTSDNSEQEVIEQSNTSQGDRSLGSLQSVVGAGMKCPVRSVRDRNTNQSTMLFQSGQVVDVLSNVQMTGQLQPSSSSDHDMQYTCTSQSQSLFGSETVLQNVAGSQQVIVTDSLGRTQTILLPSDFTKQEVVVMEGADGQQSYLDLSNVQIVHSDSTTDPMNVTFTNGSAPPNIQTPSQSSENMDADMTTISDSSKLGQTAGVGSELGEIYMCSTCNQQFDSMVLAEQHVLSEHGVDSVSSLPV